MTHSHRKSNKASTLQEGYVDKGGRNQSYQIQERPPAPAPMRPSKKGSSEADDQNQNPAPDAPEQ